MREKTVELSAICGTHFGETKEVTSITGRRAADRRLIRSILVLDGTSFDSFCRPSRGPTSTILT